MPGLLVRFARQWIAGETMQDALLRVKQGNARGISGIINLLGEHTIDRNTIDHTREEYLRLTTEIGRLGIDSHVSVKPTQLGLSINRSLCLEKIGRIVEGASKSKLFVWIDMEGSPYTEDTVSLYREILLSHPDVGLCIQANLRRSEADVRELASIGAKIRICKGAYNESPQIAYKSKQEVNRSFSNLMRILFESGHGPAVATHDDALIKEALELYRKHKVDFDFQMLLGVRDNLKNQLAAAGFSVYEYVPYGPQWLPYTVRRLREKKSNIVLAARSLLSG